MTKIYEKINWVNEQTKLNQTNMNHIENGIKDAIDGVNENNDRLNNVEDKTENVNMTFDKTNSSVKIKLGTGTNTVEANCVIPTSDDSESKFLYQTIEPGVEDRNKTWIDTSDVDTGIIEQAEVISTMSLSDDSETTILTDTNTEIYREV